MMTSVSVCAGVFELCVCSDSASVPDNRVTISAPSPSQRNLLSRSPLPTRANGDANTIAPTNGARSSSATNCSLRLRQLLLQFDELGLEVDHGVCNELDAKAARATEAIGPGVVELSMSSTRRSMRRETAASAGMSSIPKSLKAFNTGPSVARVNLSPRYGPVGRAAAPRRSREVAPPCES